MSWVTVIFSMTASACLTMALIHGFIWWRQRDSWANLLFMLAAIGTAALAGCDLAAMRAESPAQFASAIRWEQLSAWVIFLPLAGFVRLYLRAGRTWLLWTICCLRTLALFLNFLTGQNLNFRAIARLDHILFLGEAISIPVGIVPNPWMLVGQLSFLGLVIFVVDASITVWRRGDRRLAVIVGGSIAFFVLLGTGQVALQVLKVIQPPSTPSLFCLGIIVAMCYELGSQALRAAQLARDLLSSEQQIALAAEAANLGFWSQEFARKEIWANDQWRALFGFEKSERLYLDNLFQRLHPDDREMTRQVLAKTNQGDVRYQAEYRVLLPDGRTRWIASQGRVDFSSKGRPTRLRGVSLDVTHKKLADLEAQAHRNEVAHLLRVASLAELSSALAHELSQPLTAILSNAQAAQLIIAHDKRDLEDIRDILRDIVNDDKRASEVITRLRVLLKKSEFQPQQLKANELIQEVLKLMNYDLMSRPVRVVTEFAAGLPPIRGDRVQLQQVLINLILNARDAMAQSAENARTLTLRSRRAEGNLIQISVSDTGTGIPPGDEEKIFQPYHTTKPQGLGLGLSLSRSIVLAHEGRLWGENQARGGAAFHFTVPVWQGERNAALN
jgi:two-component system, LuxR family, sensor kinase FixL